MHKACVKYAPWKQKNNGIKSNTNLKKIEWGDILPLDLKNLNNHADESNMKDVESEGSDED
jgi:hypothetical protein